MNILVGLVVWIFGIACGLSVASWLIADERIGDAIVILYTLNGVVLIASLALIYVSLRHHRKNR